MDLNVLYSAVVKDHSMSRHNKHELSEATVRVPGKNPSCGDEIELFLSVADGKIVDGSFTGVGCAISEASVSIMLDLVRGKSISDANDLADAFLAMIRGEADAETLARLDEAAALQGIAAMPARVKCATMPWHTLKTALAETNEASAH